jgi:hypothetical protein
MSTMDPTQLSRYILSISSFISVLCLIGYNPNTTQTLEYTKDKYNVKIRKWKGLS